MPMYKYEVKKGVGKSRRCAKTESQALALSKGNHNLYLVGLAGHGQRSLATPRERSYSMKKTFSARLNYTPSWQGLYSILHKASKPHSKNSCGRSFSIRHILQTLHQWITPLPLPTETYKGRLLSTMKRTLKTRMKYLVLR